MTSTRKFREAIYREYMDFFRRAEKNRRWNVFDDIPWDKLDPSTYDDNATLNAETFVGVEMYLPDFVAGGINVVRDTFGHGWFQANWGYEESKHALSLREYLVKSGQRTADQMFDYEEQILAKRWTCPFNTARQMTLYGMIQEQATFMMYKRQLDLARERGDEVLTTIYKFISRDEAAHADFYRRVVQLELEDYREDVIDDLTHVFAQFKMPGTGLVPNYDSRIEVMRDMGGVDRSTFLKEVWFPLLKRLGVTRADIARAGAKRRASQSPAGPEAESEIVLESRASA